METQNALIVFHALSQETRLKAFRLLVEYGSSGAPAGTLSDKLNVPHNTLSFHLSHMSNAGLITSRREGRSIIYMVNFEMFQNLIEFMVRDCCNSEITNIGNIGKEKYTLDILTEIPKCCKK